MRCPACHADVPSGQFCLACGAAQSATLARGAVVGMSALPTMAADSAGSGSGEGRFPIGTILSERYRILGLVGRGGMGEVYRAFDLKLDQIVALKFLPAATANNVRLLDRFRGEVRLARQVSHRNVCRVHDIGDADGTAFISMEYVDGDTLANLLKQIGRLPGDKALEIARKLCAGLAAAHERGVLHRDLKPGNIMITRQGQVLLMDFGLAAVADAVVSGDIRSGTPAYMAPEQKDGREVTVRSDLYSLGLVFAEMFTGQGASHDTKLSARVSDLDPAVEKVIQRCLDPTPKNRPASAIAVARMLPGGDPLAEALAAGETPSPEVVAASEDTGVLSVRGAVACVTVVIAGLLAAPFLVGPATIMGRTPFPYAPNVLEEKARNIAATLGYPRAESDSSNFLLDMQVRLWSNRELSRDELRARMADGRPVEAAFQVQMRLSPEAPRFWAPPEIDRNTAVAELDPQGRLIRFAAVPPERDIQAPSPVNWDALAAAAGLDTHDWTRTEPQEVPIVRFDERAAWTGTYPGASKIPVRFEAAAWRGRVVWLERIGPWSVSRRPAPLAVRLVSLVAFFGLGSLAFVLAWRNYRAGRCDTVGAIRLAGFIFIVALLTRVLTDVPLFQVPLPSGIIDNPFAIAAFVGASYLALEPYVRRRWPQLMISWTRMWSGDFRSALVGGHILAGAALGVGLSSLLSVYAGAPWNYRMQMDSLTGSGFVAVLLGNSLAALGWPLATMLGLFLLRVVLRNTWLAAAVIVVAATVVVSSGAPVPIVAFVLNGLRFLAIVTILITFGLVPVVVSEFVSRLLLSSTVTTNVSMWFAPYGFVTLFLVFALSVWAFRTALGGRRVLQEDFLDH